MNWGNTKESTIDLLLTLGMMILILGFISFLNLDGWHLIISGIIITGIGVFGAMKNMKDKGIVPDWEKNKKRKNKK